MNQEKLNIDFLEINEEIGILRDRIIIYNSSIEEILGKIEDEDEINSDDMLFLNYEILRLKNVNKKLGEVVNTELSQITGFINEIFHYEKMYADTFLNSDMVLEIREKYPEFNLNSANIELKDLYKCKQLDIVVKDGSVETTLTEEDFVKIDERFEKLAKDLENEEISLELTEEDFAKILDQMGLTQAEKDKILAGTLLGIGTDGLRKFKLGDLEIIKGKNGKIEIKGTGGKIQAFLGGSIKGGKISDVLKSMMNKTVQDGKDTLAFRGGKLAKFNSLMTYLGVLNAGDDFLRNYEISGDIQSATFNVAMDVGLLAGGLYITGAVTTGVTGALAITGGGIVLVTIATGSIVTGVYNVVGSDIKEVTGGTLNKIFDELRYLKYYVDSLYY
ncbi:hypothetical protein [uncultured Clostridium sp.]|uniref:hypothetical protein n=1 Tax=uncultured Clostridium sp. TaxID=59620 RepID=UPI00263031C7|nr:hypothetical protein [uncultured Clostridium sp.]